MIPSLLSVLASMPGWLLWVAVASGVAMGAGAVLLLIAAREMRGDDPD